ncbi:MAG: hypothetical protein LBB84_00660 [Tannerellaceae bacterium]|jgi:hypothetical protein|nr:hypothetical protein [Tannerellaceae bacterium]
MKQLILCTMLILLMAGCKKDNEMIDNITGQEHVEFSLFDTNGIDLLNPANENGLMEKDIKMYREVNGEWVYLFTALSDGGGPMDHPRHFIISDGIFRRPDLFPGTKGEYRLRTWAHHDRSSRVTKTKIEWGSPDRFDILTCEWRAVGSTIINKLYMNNELLYEFPPVDGAELLHFELVRDFSR